MKDKVSPLIYFGLFVYMCPINIKNDWTDRAQIFVATQMTPGKVRFILPTGKKMDIYYFWNSDRKQINLIPNKPFRYYKQ